METKQASRSYFTNQRGDDYLGFENLRVGGKRYEVILVISNGVHSTEVYLCKKNTPPAYIPNPSKALWAKLDAAMTACAEALRA